MASDSILSFRKKKKITFGRVSNTYIFVVAPPMQIVPIKYKHFFINSLQAIILLMTRHLNLFLKIRNT